MYTGKAFKQSVCFFQIDSEFLWDTEQIIRKVMVSLIKNNPRIIWENSHYEILKDNNVFRKVSIEEFL